MNTPLLNHKLLPPLKLLSAINFNVAVVFLLVASLLSVKGSSFFFDNNSELYGPLASNLRLMMIYLTVSQFSVYCLSSYIQNYRILIPVGLFWLLLTGSIEFYGVVNQIVIDEDYSLLFLYMGMSNLIYATTKNAEELNRPD